MGKLTPSKELRTVYKVLKRIHAAEQLEETDPGMFAPEVFDIDAAQRDRIMAMLQAEGLINGVIVRFWSSVELTGNQTLARLLCQPLRFWSSVELTGNQTDR